MANIALAIDVLTKDHSSKPLAKIGDAAEKTGGKFGKLGAKAKVGMAVGATAIVGFAKSSSDKFAEVGRETVRLQRYIGGTVEDASRLRFAAEESGVGIDSLTKGLGKFSKAIVASPKDLQALGIAAKGADGRIRPMSELLPEVAEKFQNMPGGAEKTALALKLFGRSGMDLMPFLNKGADGIAELTKESDKFGNTLSSKDTAALKANIIAKRRWHAAITGVQIQLGRGLLPLLTGFASGLQRATSFVNDHSRIIKPLAIALGTLAVATFAVNKAMAAGRAVQAAALGIKALFVTATNAETGAVSRGAFAWVAHKVAVGASAVVSGVMTAAQWALNAALAANPIGLVVIGIAALVAGLVIAYKKSETFRNIVQGAMRGVAVAVDFVRDHWRVFATALAFLVGGPIVGALVLLVTHFGRVKAMASSVLSWVSGKFNALVGFMTGLPGRVGRAVSGLFNAVTSTATDANRWVVGRFAALIGYVANMPSRIGNAASGMFDGIKSAFRSAINWIIRAWNGLEFSIPGVNTHIPGVGTVGGFTLGTPNIPQLAKGGIVTRPTLALIGEAGPEAVVPLSRGRGGNSDPFLIQIDVTQDGRTTHTKLLRLKRTLGGELGLA